FVDHYGSRKRRRYRRKPAHIKTYPHYPQSYAHPNGTSLCGFFIFLSTPHGFFIILDVYTLLQSSKLFIHIIHTIHRERIPVFPSSPPVFFFFILCYIKFRGKVLNKESAYYGTNSDFR